MTAIPMPASAINVNGPAMSLMLAGSVMCFESFRSSQITQESRAINATAAKDSLMNNETNKGFYMDKPVAPPIDF